MFNFFKKNKDNDDYEMQLDKTHVLKLEGFDLNKIKPHLNLKEQCVFPENIFIVWWYDYKTEIEYENHDKYIEFLIEKEDCKTYEKQYLQDFEKLKVKALQLIGKDRNEKYLEFDSSSSYNYTPSGDCRYEKIIFIVSEYKDDNADVFQSKPFIGISADIPFLFKGVYWERSIFGLTTSSSDALRFKNKNEYLLFLNGSKKLKSKIYIEDFFSSIKKSVVIL